MNSYRARARARAGIIGRINISTRRDRDRHLTSGSCMMSLDRELKDARSRDSGMIKKAAARTRRRPFAGYSG